MTRSPAAHIRSSPKAGPQPLGGEHDKLVATTTPNSAIAKPTANPITVIDSARTGYLRLITIRSASQAIDPIPATSVRTPYIAPLADPSRTTGSPARR